MRKKSKSHQDKTALSNTELLGIEDLGNGKMTCSFEETSIMSTYLLAFCVGDYDYLEDSTKGIKVRVYTPKNQSHLGKFSLHCAVKSLEFFIDYFNINYPLLGIHINILLNHIDSVV